jgi:hypothetical protein
MKEITYAEMLNLIPGDKMTVIKEDRHSQLVCVGIHPKTSAATRQSIGMVFIQDSKWTDAVVVVESSFNKPNEKYYTGDYDRALVGKAMVDNLNRRIESVSETYLKEHVEPF